MTRLRIPIPKSSRGRLKHVYVLSCDQAPMPKNFWQETSGNVFIGVTDSDEKLGEHQQPDCIIVLELDPPRAIKRKATQAGAVDGAAETSAPAP